MTDKWQRRKCDTPPHSGLLAYWVLQKLPQNHPPSLVRIFRLTRRWVGSSTSIDAG